MSSHAHAADRHEDGRPLNRLALSATVHCLTGCAIGEVRQTAPLAFASDTASITTMEIVDNLFIMIIPGAIAAGLGDGLFWWSLAVGLLIAGARAFPVNRWLLARGKGHAAVHQFHHAH